MFELILGQFGPHVLGALLGVFVFYPYLVWKRGYYKTAAYWRDPADFSSPSAAYASLHKKHQLSNNFWLNILGHFIGLVHFFAIGGLVLGFLLIPLYLIFGITS